VVRIPDNENVSQQICEGIDYEQEQISDHQPCDRMTNERPRPGCRSWLAFVGHPIMQGPGLSDPAHSDKIKYPNTYIKIEKRKK